MRNALREIDAYTGTFNIDRRTDNAVKVIHQETGIIEWVPLSQIEEIHEQPDGSCLIIMQKWIARKKGFTDG